LRNACRTVTHLRCRSSHAPAGVARARGRCAGVGVAAQGEERAQRSAASLFSRASRAHVAGGSRVGWRIAALIDWWPCALSRYVDPEGFLKADRSDTLPCSVPPPCSSSKRAQPLSYDGICVACSGITLQADEQGATRPRACISASMYTFASMRLEPRHAHLSFHAAFLGYYTAAV
jgi:hypothetical protein